MKQKKLQIDEDLGLVEISLGSYGAGPLATELSLSEALAYHLASGGSRTRARIALQCASEAGLRENTKLSIGLESAVLGAVFGYLSLWSVYWLFKIITGKEGMGYGDFKLLAALGAWFGLAALPTIILMSSLVGAVLGIALTVTGRQNRETPMPFGPFLAGAGLIHLFYPNVLMGLIAGTI